MTKFKTVFALLILMVLICPAAIAQESSQTTAESESESTGAKNWDFVVAPMYLWAVSIDGDQTVNGVDVDLDVPFGDIFDNLNGALTVHFEGLHKQRWGFFRI